MTDLRQATEEDLLRFKECLARDEYHQGTDPLWWTGQPGEFMVFFNGKGDRVWVRIEKVLRIHMQHDPASDKADVAPMLLHIGHWLEETARSSGFAELILMSTARPLIAFIKRRLGYRDAKNEYTKLL